MSTPEINAAEVKRLVRQHWGRRAAEFDAQPHHGLHSEAQHEAWLKVLGGLAGPQPLQVLDLGCGTGFLSQLFAELGHRVQGLDIAPEMLALAREKAEKAGLAVQFGLGDAEALTAPDATYDLVVARHLIWTLPHPIPAVQEWRRVLKPGGRLALVEGHFENSEPKAEYEQIRSRLPLYGGQPSEQLVAVLTAEGYRDVTVQPLMEPVLWGETPRRPRYLIVGGR